jgi:WS/DGAT/MGAT family acyltransferase
MRGMQRLSRTDAGFMAAETADWHMHVALVGRFNADDDLSLTQLRELVERRFVHLALFRRRLRAVPGHLDRGVWEDVEHVDVDLHVHAATVRAPGDDLELGRLVGEIMSRPLARHQPLWELWRIDGCADGRVTVLLKIHHACIDGMHGAEFAQVIFDLSANAPVERPDFVSEPELTRTSTSALLGEAAVSLAKMPLRIGKVALDVAAAAPRLARFALSPERRDAVLPFEGPRTPLNGHLTPHRDFAFTSVPRALVDEVRGAFGVSLNDVVLAVAAGALRDYLDARRALPDRALVAAVPMAIRREDQRVEPDAVPGNLLSAMGAALPVHLDGPGDRMRAVQASTRAARRVHDVFGDDLLPDLLAVPPPVVVEGVVRMYDALALDLRLPPVFAAVVSNVPGPPIPLYCCGARLDDGYLLGPLLAGSGLNLTVLTYRDSLHFGVVSCPDVVDDHWAIARALPAALDDLVAASSDWPESAL